MRRSGLLVATSSLVLLSSIANVAFAETLVGLTSDGALITFDSGDPSEITASVDVTGLDAGESLVGVDFRPAGGALYGVGSTSRLYTIDLDTGAATPVGTGFTPALSGTSFGIDFNPIVDRLRLVSNTGQNMRLDPNTGSTAVVDPALNGTLTPSVVACAYVNNFSGATVTALFDIDAAQDVLQLQNPPNNGTLITVAPLGVDIDPTAGFDISPATGIGWAAFSLAGTGESTLFRIDVFSGQVTSIGPIGAGLLVTDLTTSFDFGRKVAWAVTSGGDLLSFDASAPNTIETTALITGLDDGDAPVALDLRPSNGELLLLGTAGRLYRLDRATAVATPIGTEFLPLTGSAIGLDTNPVVDRVRVVSDARQNARLNPDTGGLVALDTNLAFDASDVNSGTLPVVSAVAYDGRRPFSVSTAYVLDTNLNSLARLGGIDGTPSANTGLMFTIGPLGFDAPADVSFDIDDEGVAFAAMVPPAALSTALYLVHLPNGVARPLGVIGGGDVVVALASETSLAPNPLAIAPSSGPEAGGTEVTLTGDGFTIGAAVQVGTEDAEVTSVTTDAITFVTPPGTGVADVTVTNINGREATSPRSFTYQAEEGGGGAGGGSSDGGGAEGGAGEGGDGEGGNGGSGGSGDGGDDGCGCVVVGGAPKRPAGLLLLALAAIGAAVTRRRRS